MRNEKVSCFPFSVNQMVVSPWIAVLALLIALSKAVLGAAVYGSPECINAMADLVFTGTTYSYGCAQITNLASCSGSCAWCSFRGLSTLSSCYNKTLSTVEGQEACLQMECMVFSGDGLDYRCNDTLCTGLTRQGVSARGLNSTLIAQSFDAVTTSALCDDPCRLADGNALICAQTNMVTNYLCVYDSVSQTCATTALPTPTTTPASTTTTTTPSVTTTTPIQTTTTSISPLPTTSPPAQTTTDPVSVPVLTTSLPPPTTSPFSTLPCGNLPATTLQCQNGTLVNTDIIVIIADTNLTTSLNITNGDLIASGTIFLLPNRSINISGGVLILNGTLMIEVNATGSGETKIGNADQLNVTNTATIQVTTSDLCQADRDALLERRNDRAIVVLFDTKNVCKQKKLPVVWIVLASLLVVIVCIVASLIIWKRWWTCLWKKEAPESRRYSTATLVRPAQF